MTTAIIILNYNNDFDTINCIESIVSIEDRKQLYKLLIVDNFSSFSVQEKIDNYVKNYDSHLIISETKIYNINTIPFITHLKLAKNYGYAVGNNFGIDLCNTVEELNSILILNNDIILKEPILEKLLYSLDNLPNAAIVSPLLIKKNGSIDYNCARESVTSTQILIQHSGLQNRIKYFKKILDKRFILKHTNQHNGIIEIQLPSGSCMLFKKDFFQEIGGFDPKTFLYLEEDILFEKIKKTGKKIYLDLDVKAIHIGASTMKKTNSLFVLKHGYNSLIYFMVAYLKSPTFIIILVKLMFNIRFLKLKILKKMYGR